MCVILKKLQVANLANKPAGCATQEASGASVYSGGQVCWR